MENAETLAYDLIIQPFRNLSLNCQFNGVSCFANGKSFLPLAAISTKCYNIVKFEAKAITEQALYLHQNKCEKAIFMKKEIQ